MYSNANKNEDLNALMILYENESRINLDGELYKNTWLSKPNTLGDVAFIQIFKIIQKNIKDLSFGEKQHYNDKYFSAKYEKFINEINLYKVIEKVSLALDSSSDTKKDVAILILIELATSQKIIKILSLTENIKVFINHAYSFKKNSKFFFIFILQEYKNYREHIISTLQLLRTIYIKELNTRKLFIELGGVQLLYDYLNCGDVDIILEVLYNIEDLIYVRETFCFIFSLNLEGRR